MGAGSSQRAKAASNPPRPLARERRELAASPGCACGRPNAAGRVFAEACSVPTCFPLDLLLLGRTTKGPSDTICYWSEAKYFT